MSQHRILPLARPKVAVLRASRCELTCEMAAAFHRAGFDAIDVHMTCSAGRTGPPGDLAPWSRAEVSPR
ncbi:phosphoribosylformylglycinamidine synthase subunit PurQ [Shigella boydii]